MKACVWGFVLVGAGCTSVSPDWRGDRVGVDVPGSWGGSAEARAGIDSAWIDSFEDDRLSALVDEAMSGNPDLREMATRIDIAKANVRIAGAAGRPQLEAGWRGSRQRQNFAGFPDMFGASSVPGAAPAIEEGLPESLGNQYGLSLDLSWEVDVWGRIRAGTSSAIGQMQASQADLWAAETSLAAQVARAYFALAEADEQLVLAERTLSGYRETEAVIRERFELGQNDGGSLGTQLRLAMSDVASAEADVEARGEQRAVAVRQLEVLLGRYPEGVERGRGRLPEVPGKPPAGLPSGLLKRRPDVLAAERRYAAQGMRVREGKLALFPQLKLTGGAGTSTEELADLLDSDFGVWNLAGNVVQPILTGGQLRAQISVRKAEERAALATLQGTVLQAFSEVETALASEGFLSRQEAALARAVDLAEEAEEQARADYRGASGDFLTVLNAQVRALQAKGGLLSVRRMRLDNRVNLHLALGGDFKVRENRKTDRNHGD